jgi:creatinine amidohydrolase/Fe(II)-dependent formamide hydrolase-like protein
MKILHTTCLALAFCMAVGLPVLAQTKPADTQLVEFELMTWPELKRAIHEEGKTTVIVFNGGTEQRGPQGITAAHTFVARTLGKEIALKLGNAIVAPVVPYSVNRASAQLPGTIGVSGPLFAAINEEVAEQLITNGFRNVVLMGDHGGGQQELSEVAQKLDAKYAGQGIRVVYVDDAYKKADTDFNKWLVDNGYPVGSHAGIKDTSEMLYLGGDKGWVRKERIAVRKPGEPRDPNAKRVNNGISGDARRSSAEIGKRICDLKVEYAVAQIRRLLTTNSAQK